MPIRLTSQIIPSKMLIVTDAAWFALLDLAEEYGWNPYGPQLSGQWDHDDLGQVSYFPGKTSCPASVDDQSSRRLVILDDALNLADALANALEDYEPLRVPRSFYLFTPEIDEDLPNLGLIKAVLDISQSGAFWIDS